MGPQTNILSAKKRWLAIGLLGFVFVTTEAVSSWRDNYALLINASDSLPNWAFWVKKNKQPVRGEYAFFNLKETPITLAHWGKNPSAFGKIVYGVPGDVVTRSGNIVYVNGKAVTHLKPKTKQGETLQPGPIGTIPAGHYFLATWHPDGFDSRYNDIGFVPSAQIWGTSQEPIL
jgi:conjugal transfer pilin signal peptidase TrbI